MIVESETEKDSGQDLLYQKISKKEDYERK